MALWVAMENIQKIGVPKSIFKRIRYDPTCFDNGFSQKSKLI